jgi:hypothetical protein
MIRSLHAMTTFHGYEPLPYYRSYVSAPASPAQESAPASPVNRGPPILSQSKRAKTMPSPANAAPMDTPKPPDAAAVYVGLVLCHLSAYLCRRFKGLEIQEFEPATLTCDRYFETKLPSGIHIPSLIKLIDDLKFRSCLR